MRYCRTSLSVGLYLLIYTVCSLFMLQFQYVWTMKLNLPVSNTLKWLCFPVLALSLTCNYLKGRLSAGSTVEFKVWYISSRLWFGPSAWVVTGSLGQSGGIILSPRLREASRKCTGGWMGHSPKPLFVLRLIFMCLSDGYCHELLSAWLLTFALE